MSRQQSKRSGGQDQSQRTSTRPAASFSLCQASQPLHCASTRPLSHASGFTMRDVRVPVQWSTSGLMLLHCWSYMPPSSIGADKSPFTIKQPTEVSLNMHTEADCYGSFESCTPCK